MPGWRGFGADHVISSSCRDIPSSSYTSTANSTTTGAYFPWLGGLGRFRRRRHGDNTGDSGSRRGSVSADAEFTRSTADVSSQSALARAIAMTTGIHTPPLKMEYNNKPGNYITHHLSIIYNIVV